MHSPSYPQLPGMVSRGQPMSYANSANPTMQQPNTVRKPVISVFILLILFVVYELRLIKFYRIDDATNDGTWYDTVTAAIGPTGSFRTHGSYAVYGISPCKSGK